MPAYYIKPAKTCYAPSSIVSVIVDQKLIRYDRGRSERHYALRRVSACASVLKYGQWSAPTTVSFTDGNEFHDWLEAWSQPKRRTYVFAPTASAVLTHTGFWARIAQLGCTWESTRQGNDAGNPGNDRGVVYRFRDVLLRGDPDIVRYSVRGRGICWLSSVQFISATESQLGEMLAGSGHTPGSGGTSVNRAAGRAGNRAQLWLKVIQQLCEWWREHKGGPWALTVGGLAMSYFRARLTPKTVLRHDDDEARKIEERALFGGRASLYFMGPVGFTAGVRKSSAAKEKANWPEDGGGTGRRSGQPANRPPPSHYPGLAGPVHQIDVRSMYPYLLATSQFPVKLIAKTHNPPVKHVRELLNNYCVIATVRLGARSGEYPFRVADGVRYPVGRFDTALCGPDLIRSIESDEVEEVYTACVYQSGQPFRQMATELLTARIAAIDSDRPVWEQFIKNLSNTFAGKMAQRSGQWMRKPNMPAELEWGEWYALNESGTAPARYRALAGLVWEYTRDTTSTRPLAACFAYLTSYGRCMMRRIRESCPIQSVVSQDTDGLWVTDEGLESIPVRRGKDSVPPGAMRLVETCRSAQWYTPRHYWADGTWVLAGYHDAKYLARGRTFVDRHTLNKVFCSRGCPAPVVTVRERHTSLSTIPCEGEVSPLGWVYPRLIV